MALIMIVDDSPTEVHVLKTALEKHGFDTVSAADGDPSDSTRLLTYRRQAFHRLPHANFLRSKATCERARAGEKCD